MLSAVARRSAQRMAPRAVRNYASSAEVSETANAFIAQRKAIEAHAGGTFLACLATSQSVLLMYAAETMDLWRRVRYASI
jgi:hypothetical protein